MVGIAINGEKIVPFYRLPNLYARLHDLAKLQRDFAKLLLCKLSRYVRSTFPVNMPRVAKKRQLSPLIPY